RIKPWRSLLIGLVILLLGWLIALLALLLVLGLSFFLFWLSLPNLGFLVAALGLLAIGLALVVYWLSIVFFSKVVVAFLVGRMLFSRIMPRYAHSKVWPLLTGVVLYALLASIPYLGWVIAVFTTMFGLGALWMVSTASPPRLRQGEPAPMLQPADDDLNVGLPAG
ncbi:MAG TPA: hypothetical protein VJ785_04505, partial [Anaerolineales bacterium]|nr:hypothetical protein [Anaerolineales bacterium]